MLKIDVDDAIKALPTPVFRAVGLSLRHGMTEREIKQGLKVASETIAKVKELLRERLAAWRN